MKRLCDDCGVTNDDKTPCQLMFGKDVIDVCTRYEKNPKVHETLAKKAASDTSAKKEA